MAATDDFREVCERAARAGGQVLLDWMGKFEIREKGPADLVTDADLASQEIVQQTLLGAFPLHGFLGEENKSIPSRDQGYRWIVDPLDGTTNYAHGIPAFAVSIALERAGEIVVGCVYEPVRNDCYLAVAGQGATLNSRPLRVSTITDLSKAVVAMSLPPQLTRDSRDLAEFIEVALVVQSMRRIGSAALNMCYVAAGQFDAFWSTNTKIWDVAAGVLLIQEAGGLVTNLQGGPFSHTPPHFLSAATPQLHGELLRLLQSVRG